MIDVDLFAFYRWVLFIIGTVYTVVVTARSLWSWVEFLWAPERWSGPLRRYVLVQALRIRIRRFTLELAQIAALTAAFFILVWLHRRLGFVD